MWSRAGFFLDERLLVPMYPSLFVSIGTWILTYRAYLLTRTQHVPRVRAGETPVRFLYSVSWVTPAGVITCIGKVTQGDVSNVELEFLDGLVATF